jgi:hypothetical protein
MRPPEMPMLATWPRRYAAEETAEAHHVGGVQDFEAGGKPGRLMNGRRVPEHGGRAALERSWNCERAAGHPPQERQLGRLRSERRSHPEGQGDGSANLFHGRRLERLAHRVKTALAGLLARH